jgi:hypothetical protein
VDPPPADQEAEALSRDRTTAAELIAGIARTTPILDLTVEEPLIEDVYAGNRAGTGSV